MIEPSPLSPLDRGSEADSPLGSRESGVVLTLCGLALLLRLINLQQLRANDPFFFQPSVDPRFYHDWAVRIAGGDWLGEGVFLQGPLYPYLLGVLYKITGANLFMPRLLQCLLGTLTCWLVWRLSRDLFGRGVALIALAMAAVYSMSIFYEGSLLIANILPPLILAILLAIERADRDPTAARWLQVGLLVGLCSLARPNMMLYMPFALGWLVYVTRGRLEPRRRAIMALALCGGFALCIGPSLARNYFVSGDFVLVSASAGMNFYNGNNPDANGLHKVPSIFDRSQADTPLEQNRIYKAEAEKVLGRELLASEVSDYWLGLGLDYVMRNPADWSRLMGKKFLLFVNRYEAWNNRSSAVTRQFSWILRLPLLTFGVMAPFAFLGMALAIRRWRRALPLYAVIGVYLVTNVVFFTLSRYREPVVPVLFVFAAFALVWLVDAARPPSKRALAAAGAALVGFALVVHLDVMHEDLSVAYYNLGNKYRALDQHELAIAQYDRSLEINPAYISAHNNRALALEAGDRPRSEVISAWRVVQTLGERRGLARYQEIASRHLHALAEAEEREGP